MEKLPPRSPPPASFPSQASPATSSRAEGRLGFYWQHVRGPPRTPNPNGWLGRQARVTDAPLQRAGLGSQGGGAWNWVRAGGPWS